MLRFAANLSLMYPEMPLLERVAAAKADGFVGVECQFPYEIPAAQMLARLQQHDLTQVLFNAWPGDLAAGDFGIAALPGREHEFAESLNLTLSYALALNCRRVHVMAGLIRQHGEREAMRATYVANLKKACERFVAHDILVLIEPINTRDMPGYFLNRQVEAHAVLHEVAAPNLRMQMDFYHLQVVEGDIARKLERYRQHLGHVQIAGVPARTEPDLGEVNYAFVLDLLDRFGYAGWVGCEYRPSRAGPGGTSAGLGWLGRYRI